MLSALKCHFVFALAMPELFWFFIGIAVICIVVSIGLQRRTWWMWYAGWVLLFLMAGFMGAVFLGNMPHATDWTEIVHGFIYLGVGLSFCVAIAVWWAKNRERFGLHDHAPKSRADRQSAPPPKED